MNPYDWSLVDNRNQFITDRGFTLHEHYDQMQIINMVARLYDPILGQFISVDPMADLYPGWAPYVYCYNNPLVFVDPTGEIILFSDWEDMLLFDDLMSALGDMEDELYDEMDGLDEDSKEYEKLDEQLTEVQDALWEINMMEMDEDNVFVISHNDNMDKGLGGSFGYSGVGDIFNAQVNSKGDNKVASLAHELTHGFQYMKGEVSFYGKELIDYDQTDEINARMRAVMLGRIYKNGVSVDYSELGEMSESLNTRRNLKSTESAERASQRYKNKGYKYNKSWYDYND